MGYGRRRKILDYEGFAVTVIMEVEVKSGSVKWGSEETKLGLRFF